MPIIRITNSRLVITVLDDNGNEVFRSPELLDPLDDPKYRVKVAKETPGSEVKNRVFKQDSGGYVEIDIRKK